MRLEFGIQDATRRWIDRAFDIAQQRDAAGVLLLMQVGAPALR